MNDQDVNLAVLVRTEHKGKTEHETEGAQRQRISEREIPDGDRLYPIRSLFNAIPDRDFVVAIRECVHRVGIIPLDGVGCSFPDEEFPFEGVEIWTHYLGEVVVDESTFLRYIRLACDAYVEAHPTDKDIITCILEHSELV